MPLCIDLYCGLGGWAEGFLAEGWDVIGFDVERHRYRTRVVDECGVKRSGMNWSDRSKRGAKDAMFNRPAPLAAEGGWDEYPGKLVLQDVLTLHGSQFRNADCIVASPPCQAYSYMAMPWKRAKREIRWQEWERNSPFGDRGESLTALFRACFRIQREACAAAGRHIPMVVENVKGAQRWVGKAKAHFGSFYLWGDVDNVGGATIAGRPQFGRVLRRGSGGKANPHGTEHGQGSWFAIAGRKNRGQGRKGPGGDWFDDGRQGQDACALAVEGTKQRGSGADWFDTGIAALPSGSNGRKTPAHINDAIRNGQSPARWTNRAEDAGVKNGADWFADGDDCSVQRKCSSKSTARKAASAQIAKIPFPLARYIAQSFKP